MLNATKNKGFLKLFFCKLSGSQDTIRQKLKLLEAKIGIFLFFSNFDFLCFCSFLIFLAELLKVSSWFFYQRLKTCKVIFLIFFSKSMQLKNFLNFEQFWCFEVKYPIFWLKGPFISIWMLLNQYKNNFRDNWMAIPLEKISHQNWPKYICDVHMGL